MLTLNLIGGGRLGCSMTRLWRLNGQFRLQQILSSNFSRAKAARRFIGYGEAVADLDAMTVADAWLIATPDGEIEKIAEQLATTRLIRPETTVFHCSGSLSSKVLHSLQRHTQKLASVHPIHSFASPEKSVGVFKGTFCAYEGNEDALTLLVPAFERVGGRMFPIHTDDKTVYHAASVIACNYLTALLDASLECFSLAGVPENQASEILMPIVHQTVDNALRRTPADALTGPISRGDKDTVAHQLHSLQAIAPALAEIYQIMGRRTLKVAKDQGLSEDAQQHLQQILTPKDP